MEKRTKVPGKVALDGDISVLGVVGDKSMRPGASFYKSSR